MEDCSAFGTMVLNKNVVYQTGVNNCEVSYHQEQSCCSENAGQMWTFDNQSFYLNLQMLNAQNKQTNNMR